MTRRPLDGVRVLVTDADGTLGLFVIRALGRAGARVTALGRGGRPERVMGFASRFVTRRHLLPAGPYGDVLGTALDDLAADHDVLVPAAARSIEVVAASAAHLAPRIRFHVPDLDAFRLANDKAAMTSLAARLGVPAPVTYHGITIDVIDDWARAASFPLVVKFSTDWSDRLPPGERYRVVRSPAALTREFRRMHAVSPGLVVQEYVEGPGHACSTLVDGAGAPVATFCHRRIRENPMSGGPSTLCESTADPTLVTFATRLLAALGWRGIAMVEFKHDRRSGTYRFLEINPRFWGSLPLALHCGVNFPVYQVELALGRRPAPRPSYPVGKKMRFLLPDFMTVVRSCRAARSPVPALPFLRDLLDLRIRDGLFELDDPLPWRTVLLNRLGAAARREPARAA